MMVGATLKAYSRIAPTGRGAYRLVRCGRRLIPRDRWRGDFMTPDDVSLELDLATYPDCLMAFGLYELDTYRELRRLLHTAAWFVDCGANIGYFSLHAARWMPGRGRVDAFEPDPLNRKRLLANVRADPLGDSVTVHDIALSDHAGKLAWFHPTGADTNHGMAGAFAVGGAEVERSEVACIRLDQYLTGGIPDVIKIDIEGGELAAIRGMSGLLGCDRPPSIIVEHNPESAAAAHFSPGDLFRALAEIQPRYRFFWIGRRLKPIQTPATLDAITRQGNLLVCTESRMSNLM